jgi:hypothetical protein
MKIKILNHEGKLFRKPSNGNPWKYFFEELEKNDYKIVKNKFDLKYDVLICNGYKSKIELLMIRILSKPKLSYLMIWEPIQSDPRIYKRKFLNGFNEIFVPSPIWAIRKNTQFFNWPQNTQATPLETFSDWQNRANKVVCIFANKFSVIKGEQYSLRRKILIDPKMAKEVDLFGRNWDRSHLWNIFQIFKSFIKSNGKLISLQSLKDTNPNIRNYLGSVENKVDAISNYRFSLVIENSADYLSEKLFDASISQSIVVFVGIDLDKIGLSKEIAIHVDPSADKIRDKVSQLIELSDQEQYNIFIKQQNEFRRILREWDNKYVLSKLATDICKISSL